MATLTKVGSTSAPQKTSFEPEIVNFSVVSLFKSHAFKIVGTAAVLVASVVWILPEAASLMDAALDPLLIKSLLGTILVGAAWVGLNLKKELLYEISILWTIARFNPWWTVIDEHIVLGAIPLEHQIEEIKALGVTHVIPILEHFELEPGIVQPAQGSQWEANGIICKHFVAEDFYGVPKVTINAANNYIEEQRKINPKAKFYIHCKAGIGRSTTIVLCNKMKRDPVNFPTKEKTFEFIKEKRTQVNLNKNQMLAAQDFLDIAILVT